MRNFSNIWSLMTWFVIYQTNIVSADHLVNFPFSSKSILDDIYLNFYFWRAEHELGILNIIKGLMHKIVFKQVRINLIQKVIIKSTWPLPFYFIFRFIIMRLWIVLRDWNIGVKTFLLGLHQWEYTSWSNSSSFVLFEA